MTNGSLYLVTGCDKATTWGAAAYSNHSQNGEVNIKFVALEALGTGGSARYRFDTHHAVAWRVAPRPHPDIGPEKENQCLFIRGFKIAIRQGILAKVFGPAQMFNVIDTRDKDSSFGRNLSRRGRIPFSSQRGHSVSSSLVGSGLLDNNRLARAEKDVS